MPVLELNRADAAAKAKEIAGLDLKPEDIQVIQIRIKKGSVAKGEQCIAEVSPDCLPQEEIAIIWQLGFEARINGTGFSKVEKGDAEEALRVAAENIQKLYDGKLRAPVGLASAKKAKSKAAKDTDKAVLSEARRLARAEIKDRIRAAGEKVSHYAAKDINKAADQILEEDDEIATALWDEAKKVVAERNKATEQVEKLSAKKGKAIELIKGIAKDPEAIAKAEKKLAAAAAKKAKTREARANA